MLGDAEWKRQPQGNGAPRVGLWLLFARPCSPIHSHGSLLPLPGIVEPRCTLGLRRVRIMRTFWTVHLSLRHSVCRDDRGGHGWTHVWLIPGSAMCSVSCKLFALKQLILYYQPSPRTVSCILCSEPTHTHTHTHTHTVSCILCSEPTHTHTHTHT